MDSKDFAKATKQKANIDARKGGNYSYFDGWCSGTFNKIVKNELIDHSWNVESWSHGSRVVYKFKKEKDGTRVFIEHTGIPRFDIEGKLVLVEDFKEGWLKHHFKLIADFLGFEIISD